MSIKYSFIGCAIRSQLYLEFCNNMPKFKSSYEIIFAGQEPPIEKMPSNFKYIVTKAHPAWATEIAARHAVGEYLIVIADDLAVSKGYLDRLDYYTNKMCMEKSLIGGRFRYANHEHCNDTALTIDDKIVTAPVFPFGIAYKRDLWNELGGVDDRFIGSYYDLDMAMRFYERGYTPFIMPDAHSLENRKTYIPSYLWKKTGEKAREVLNECWVKDGKYSLKRLSPVRSISDEYIKKSIEKIIG